MLWQESATATERDAESDDAFEGHAERMCQYLDMRPELVEKLQSMTSEQQLGWIDKEEWMAEAPALLQQMEEHTLEAVT